MDNKSCKITITGRVQGVGFRPHVYRMAMQYGLFGYINNSVNGVEIEVSGPGDALDGFVRRLNEFPPPLAVIEKFHADNIAFKQYSKFEILHSDPVDMPVNSVFVSPDLAVCADCAAEIFDKNDRRYGYAFANCTNCGPRYTITRKLPYDRPVTTMSVFKMCPKCQAEYDDPLNRRFHAQPNACPECGPGLAIVEDLGAACSGGFGRLEFSKDTAAVIERTAGLLMDGRIGALMGLGGFHIACRADSDEIALRLRELKNRPAKPFALMAPSMEWIRRFCEVSPEEEALLTSSVSPIVLLKRHNRDSGFNLSGLIAPDNNYLGFMLPYTPLHLLLMKAAGAPLVMTSANISDEPICFRLDQAAEKLGGICDFAMAHNREILIPCDDSVCFVEDGKTFTVRPSRGIAPCVISTGGDCAGAGKTNIALGAILKNTVSFNLDKKILISQYIGDTDNLENYELLVSTAERFGELYNLKPGALVCDNHHGSNAAAYAAETAERAGAELISVGHHYAHALSVMAENDITGPVICLSFDGTGLGDDGSVWGGEFLVCDTAGYKRAAYFEPFRVVNYDGAVKNTAKLTFCAAHDFFGDEGAGGREVMDFFKDFDLSVSADEMNIISKALKAGVNTVKSSSLGRIFDAVSAAAGFNRPVSFEGEAAIWLEMQASYAQKDQPEGARFNGASSCADLNGGAAGVYHYEICGRGEALIINWRGILKGAIIDRKSGMPAGAISSKFHRTIIKAVYETACIIADKYKVYDICLAGGVFFNRILLGGLLERLSACGGSGGCAPKADDGVRPPLKVYLPRRVSFGDSAISAGQCYYAIKRKN